MWRSANGGGAWSSQTLSGSPDLYGAAFPAPSTAYVCGSTGAIWNTDDGGVTWHQQFTLTAATFRAIHFTDALDGWAVGDFGTVRRTADGGESWQPIAVPTTNRLRAIDRSGDTIWIVGERGTCMRSLDGGDTWEHVNLKLDARSDVTAVKVISPSTIWIAGGGGFVRRSTDGGATWTFLQHKLHGALTGLSVVGNRAQICSSKHRGVFNSQNNGVVVDDARGRDAQPDVRQQVHPRRQRLRQHDRSEPCGRRHVLRCGERLHLSDTKRRRDMAAVRFPPAATTSATLSRLAEGH